MEADGVIKYQLAFKKSDPVDNKLIAEINSWRDILYQLKVVGQSKKRYAGYCFGNLSRRMPNPGQFVISASQTGIFPALDNTHYTIVTECITAKNKISATGVMEPSSESLSHAAVYQVLPDVQYVYHAHCPEIWQNAARLNIPTTSPDVPYGTVELADEISALCLKEETQRCRIVSMGGHEDGIIVFGKTAAEAGTTLVAYLAAAGVKAC